MSIRKRLQMELKDVKNISFPKPSFEEWKAAVETSLKGKTIDKLQTNTYEGVTLQPLYTRESVGDNSRVTWFFSFYKRDFTNRISYTTMDCLPAN